MYLSGSILEVSNRSVANVVELVNTPDCGSGGRNALRVRVASFAPKFFNHANEGKENVARHTSPDG